MEQQGNTKFSENYWNGDWKHIETFFQPIKNQQLLINELAGFFKEMLETNDTFSKNSLKCSQNLKTVNLLSGFSPLLAPLSEISELWANTFTRMNQNLTNVSLKLLKYQPKCLADQKKHKKPIADFINEIAKMQKLETKTHKAKKNLKEKMSEYRHNCHKISPKDAGRMLERLKSAEGEYNNSAEHYNKSLKRILPMMTDTLDDVQMLETNYVRTLYDSLGEFMNTNITYLKQSLDELNKINENIMRTNPDVAINGLVKSLTVGCKQPEKFTLCDFTVSMTGVDDKTLKSTEARNMDDSKESESSDESDENIKTGMKPADSIKYVNKPNTSTEGVKKGSLRNVAGDPWGMSGDVAHASSGSFSSPWTTFDSESNKLQNYAIQNDQQETVSSVLSGSNILMNSNQSFDNSNRNQNTNNQVFNDPWGMEPVQQNTIQETSGSILFSVDKSPNFNQFNDGRSNTTMSHSDKLPDPWGGESISLDNPQNYTSSTFLSESTFGDNRTVYSANTYDMQYPSDYRKPHDSKISGFKVKSMIEPRHLRETHSQRNLNRSNTCIPKEFSSFKNISQNDLQFPYNETTLSNDSQSAFSIPYIAQQGDSYFPTNVPSTQSGQNFLINSTHKDSATNSYSSMNIMSENPVVCQENSYVGNKDSFYSTPMDSPAGVFSAELIDPNIKNASPNVFHKMSMQSTIPKIPQRRATVNMNNYNLGSDSTIADSPDRQIGLSIAEIVDYEQNFKNEAKMKITGIVKILFPTSPLSTNSGIKSLSLILRGTTQFSNLTMNESIAINGGTLQKNEVTCHIKKTILENLDQISPDNNNTCSLTVARYQLMDVNPDLIPFSIESTVNNTAGGSSVELKFLLKQDFIFSLFKLSLIFPPNFQNLVNYVSSSSQGEWDLNNFSLSWTLVDSSKQINRSRGVLNGTFRCSPTVLKEAVLSCSFKLASTSFYGTSVELTKSSSCIISLRRYLMQSRQCTIRL